jgi:hypothetical protein
VVLFSLITCFAKCPETSFTLPAREARGPGQSFKGTGAAVLMGARNFRSGTFNTAQATTDAYVQEIPESVQATVNAINAELRVKQEEIHAD